MPLRSPGPFAVPETPAQRPVLSPWRRCADVARQKPFRCAAYCGFHARKHPSCAVPSAGQFGRPQLAFLEFRSLSLRSAAKSGGSTVLGI